MRRIGLQAVDIIAIDRTATVFTNMRDIKHFGLLNSALCLAKAMGAGNTPYVNLMEPK